MLTGQIGLVHGTGFWPHAIEVVQALAEPVNLAHWNHIIVGVSETEFAEEAPGGARIRPISDFDHLEVVWSRFPLTMHQRSLISKWAIDHSATQGHPGVPYGYFDVAAIGLSILLKQKTPDWIQAELSNGKTYECAAFADADYRAAGVHLFDDDRPTAAVYPASIASRFDPAWFPRKPGTLKGWT